MNTTIASDTFYTIDPQTKQKRRHRIQLRKIKPYTVKDNTGNETLYTHGICSGGVCMEPLTKDEARKKLVDNMWDWVNRDLI